MMTVELTAVLAAIQSADNASSLLTVVDGEFRKATLRAVGNMAFYSISNSDDLDNPTSRGVFNVNADTPITRPSKGTGWQYGYIFNMATSTGIQVWFNFSGYIALRGKGSSSAPWSDWSVFQPMLS